MNILRISKAGRTSRSIAEGVASVDLRQRMTISRKRCAAGSLQGDWLAIGKDVKHAVESIRREFETA